MIRIRLTAALRILWASPCTPLGVLLAAPLVLAGPASRGMPS